MNPATKTGLGIADGFTRIQHYRRTGDCPFTEWREGSGYFWALSRTGPWNGPYRSREVALTAALDPAKRKR